MKFTLSTAQLKVASSVLSNFVVFWLGSMLVTRNVILLTADFILATLSWYLAVTIEKTLENI